MSEINRFLGEWVRLEVVVELDRVEVLGPNSFGRQFQPASAEEIDAELESLICEAYAVGRQEHLARRQSSR